MISFLLLTLGFIISFFFFLVVLGVNLGYLFDFSLVSCIVMNLPLRTAFTEAHWVWVVVFSFSFVPMHILIFFMTCWLLRSMMFSLHMFVFFFFFFKFYFIFKLYNIVLVLPNIEMNPPQVYPRSPS